LRREIESVSNLNDLIVPVIQQQIQQQQTQAQTQTQTQIQTQTQTQTPPISKLNEQQKQSTNAISKADFDVKMFENLVVIENYEQKELIYEEISREELVSMVRSMTRMFLLFVCVCVHLCVCVCVCVCCFSLYFVLISCVFVLKKLGELQILKYEKSLLSGAVHSARRTIQLMCSGQRYFLNDFKSIKDKENLLKEAVLCGDTDVLIIIILFCSETLKFPLFMYLLKRNAVGFDCW
jgi:hypothetical protein